MRRKIRSIAVAAGLAVSALSVPLVTAAPAEATSSQCINYLGIKGYVIGPKVRSNCKKAAHDNRYSDNARKNLRKIGVSAKHAERAVDYAMSG